jgi:hypothetical protein
LVSSVFIFSVLTLWCLTSIPPTWHIALWLPRRGGTILGGESQCGLCCGTSAGMVDVACRYLF